MREAVAKRRPMRPPRALALVRDPEPEEVGAVIDWSGWYLFEEDDVGQSPEQDDVASEFASALREHLLPSPDPSVRVGCDAFFAWIRDEPNVRVSPDVYVLDDPPPPPWPKMWETWRAGHRAPRFALEVVSDDWRKDYEEAPAKYALLGASELLIFDPPAGRGAVRAPRVPITVYRREDDGSFVRTYAGEGPARLESIDAWAVARPEGGVGWLRLARDAEGTEIVPTARERAEQEAQRAERLRERLRSLGIDPDDEG